MKPFLLPILNVLAKMKDEKNPEISVLDSVILRLYREKHLEPKEIAALLGLSLHTIYKRLPDDFRDFRLKEIVEMHKNGSTPKEIAYKLKEPVNKIYRAIRKYRKESENEPDKA